MSLSPVAIKEANHHIQGLVKRVHELEEQVKELSEALRKQNEAHAENLKILPLRMNQTLRQKDEEIQELRQKLQSSEALIERLVREASEHEASVHHLKNRSRVLDEICKQREAFESVLTCLSLLEEPDDSSTSEAGKIAENCIPRETDLLDSDEESEDINGNESSHVKRVDSGIGSSYSSFHLENGRGIEKETLPEENSFGDVFSQSEEKPAPCFV
ncbi:vimentin-type intermediate filament-associated coiled-coil protein-like [Oculina patagonica]